MPPVVPIYHFYHHLDMANMKRLLDYSMKGNVAQATTMVIAAATTIFIGIWVLSMIMSSISQAGWTTAANTTYTTVQTITWNSIQLLSVGLVVLAAALILTYFGLGRQNQ